VSNPFQVGSFVPEGGMICGHCSDRPFCLKDCPASMFYVYPRRDLGDNFIMNMSRLAVHIGSHNHPPRESFSRESVKRASDIVQKHVFMNPSMTPSRVRSFATKDLL
jgi:hypothetical protein